MTPSPVTIEQELAELMRDKLHVGQHDDERGLYFRVDGIEDAAKAILDRLALSGEPVAQEVEALKAKLAAFEDDQEAERAIAFDLSGGLDQFDAAADKWLALGGVDRMIQALTSVFAKWASADIMARFQQKMKDLMHQAFVEGAVSYAYAVKIPAPANSDADAPLSPDRGEDKGSDLAAENERLRAALEKIANSPGARGIGEPTHREIARAALSQREG